MRGMWFSGCRYLFWHIYWRTVETGVVVLTLGGMECAKVEVGKMWIQRVVEGLRGKAEAGVEDEVGTRDEEVGGIISVVGTVDV